MTDAKQWFWCLKHERVEPLDGCRDADRLGPYDTPEAAEHWQERVAEQNRQWEREDEEWNGE